MPTTVTRSPAIDGRLEAIGASWDNCHIASNASTASKTDAAILAGFARYGSSRYICRAFFAFDTEIPDGAILESAKLSLTTQYFDGPLIAGMDLVLVSTQLTDITGVGQYTLSNWGTTSYGYIPYGSIPTGTPPQAFDITLNATGLAALNLTGTTYLGLRHLADLGVTDPGASEDKQVNIWMQEATTAAYRPVLTLVYYTVAPPTGITVTSKASMRQTVEWTKSAGATGYKLYRDTTAGATTLLATLGDVDTYTYVADYGRYFYRIKAIGPDHDSQFSAEVAKSTSFLDNAWTRSENNPNMSGRLMATNFAQSAGSDISGLGFTKTTKWGAAHIDTATGGTGAVHHGTGSAAYFRDTEYDDGKSAVVTFRYASQPATSSTLGVGINCSEDGSGFDGYMVSIEKQASDNAFRLNLHRYDNGTGTTLNTYVAVTLAPNTDYKLIIGRGGVSRQTYKNIYAAVYAVATLDTVVSTIVPINNDWTYSGGKTVLLTSDPAYTIATFDNGADSWFCRFVRPVLVDGDWTQLHADDDGYLWAAYEAGDAASNDRICLARGSYSGFTDAGRMYDGVAGAVGPVIQTAVPLTATPTWDAADASGWNSADTQMPWIIYDSAADLFKLWYGSHDGHDIYRIGYAYATPDASGAPPTTPAGWTKHSGGPFNLANTSGTYTTNDGEGGSIQYYPAVVKKPVTHAATEYAYQMLYQGGGFAAAGGQAIFLAYSNDGTTWTKHNKTTTGAVLAFPGEYLVQLTSLMYDTEISKWRLICDVSTSAYDLRTTLARSYVSADLYSWTLEAGTVLPYGATGQWDDTAAADLTIIRDDSTYTITAVYAGNPDSSGQWPNLKTGLASQTGYYNPAPTNVNASLVGADVELTWENNSPTADSTIIQRSIDSGAYADCTGSPAAGDATSFTDTDLPGSWNTAQYRVASEDDGDQSPWAESNTLIGLVALDAEGTVSASIDAALVVARMLTAEASSSTTADAALLTIRSLAAEGSGSVVADALLTVARFLQAEASGTVSGDAAFEGQVDLDAEGTVSSIADAALTVVRLLSAEGVVSAAVDAGLDVVHGLAAEIALSVTADAVLRVVRLLSAEGVVSVTGDDGTTVVYRARPRSVTTAINRPTVTAQVRRASIRED